ncbi:putative aldolase class 2 protein CC_1201 [Liolophura sinensis]|uniref:putative aldolase class 2 protein CC_1201 n=1 Tax=Liolophura sinensis TaxID=3198878 RepID=UPI0031589606
MSIASKLLSRRSVCSVTLMPNGAVTTYRLRPILLGQIARFSCEARSPDPGSHVQANRAARFELAVAYRALERYKLHEGVCNHLSLMCPAASGRGQVMLIIPHGQHWSQVTRSSLLGVDEHGQVVEGNGQAETSAVSIHLGLHLCNQDARCVMHAHTPYATSLGLLKDPSLLMCHQISTRFHNRVAYDPGYQGMAYEVEEGRRLASVLGSKDILMMCNHGIITSGRSVAMAFDLMYYLERACMFQMIAMATGKQLNTIPDDMVKYNCEVFKGDEEDYANKHFNAMKDIILNDSPDVKN